MGCATGNCRSQNIIDKMDANSGSTSTPNPTPVDKSTQESFNKIVSDGGLKIKVYKPDGSKQCGEGKAIALDVMEKELKNIKVYSKFKKNDGQIRMQMCGTQTGDSNVYEISKQDLETAQKAGFKQWIFE